jgi:hypothetical protein
MVYDGFFCYFFSTCQIDCQGDLIVYFTMFIPFRLNINSFIIHTWVHIDRHGSHVDCSFLRNLLELNAQGV